jgi:hypothetical protein
VLLVVRGGGVGPFLHAIAANLAYATGTDYGAVDSPTGQRVDLAAVVFRLTDWLAPAAEPVALVGVLAVSVLLVRRLDRLADPAATAVADLLTCLTVVVAVVHQPGDVLLAVPAATLAVVVWRERGWPLVGLAVAALAVPFAHLHVVDSAVRALFSARAAITLDGVAVVAAWLVLVVFAARLTRAARPAGVLAGRAG